MQYGYNADDRESASVAHIYGQNIAAAESMTAAAAPWGWSPATLKPTADQELLNGINRFVIHESAHQPLVGKAPGLTLGPFGQWFNRNETWAEQAGAWIDYLARSSYMLQQGHFGADLVYFYGEDSNLTAIFQHRVPEIPAGYGFDYINADALIHELNVTNGRIVTKSGMEYKVLGLDPYSRHMSLPVLRAIHELVEEGAVVAARNLQTIPAWRTIKPSSRSCRRELFGDGTGVHKVGKGTVYAGQSLAEVFNALNLTPDFDYAKTEPMIQIWNSSTASSRTATSISSNNRSDHDEIARCRHSGWLARRRSCGVRRLVPRKPASFKMADGRTTVPLHLEPWGTVFVVFRKPTSETSHTIPKLTETKMATIDGPWNVAFQPDRGAPDSVTMNELSDWSRSDDPGVKYFSGVGTYTKTVQALARMVQEGIAVVARSGRRQKSG